MNYVLARLEQNAGSGVVGIFDSGVGGLSVVSNLWSTFKTSGLPSLAQILYLGDTENFPYGEKTEEQLTVLLLEDMKWLCEHDAEMIVIACNTASSVWNSLFPAGHQKVFDTLTTVASKLAGIQATRIGVIATQYTVDSHAFERIIHTTVPQDMVTVISSAEQPLVGAIERGDTQAIKTEIDRIAKYFLAITIDAFILGCTHYAHILVHIEQALPGVMVIDPSSLLAERVSATALTLQNQKVSHRSNPAPDSEKMSDDFTLPVLALHFTGVRPNVTAVLGGIPQSAYTIF